MFNSKQWQPFSKYFPKIYFFWACCVLPFHNVYAQNTEEFLTKLKKTLAASTTDGQRIPILNDLTAHLLETGRDSVLFYAEQSYQIRGRAVIQQDKIRTIILKGVALQKSKVSEKEARYYFDDAIVLAKELKDLNLLAYGQMKLGEFCCYRGGLEEGIKHYEIAKKYYEKTNDLGGIQRIYHNLASAYNQQGRLQAALDMYLQSLKALRDLKRQDLMGILSDIGNVYFNQGSFIQALKYYKEAFALSSKFQNTHAEGFCLNNIGLVHNSLGNYDQALQYHIDALKKREEAKTLEGISNSYINIGNTYTQLGYHEKGRDYIKKSLEIETKLGNPNTIATGFDYIGTSFLSDQKYTEALQSYQKALDIRQASEQAIGVGVSYGQIGVVHSKQLNQLQALFYFNKADSIFTTIGAQDLATTNNIRLAHTYFELGELNKSNTPAQKALASALKRKTKNEIVESSQILGKIYAKKGQHEQAYSYQVQALAYKDSLNVDEKNKRISRTQALFEFKNQEKQLTEKDHENKKLKKDNTTQKETQTIIFVIFGLLLAISVAFLYYSWVGRKRNLKKNELLASQNEEIIRQNGEIFIQHQAIELQNSELQITHKGLSEANQELLDSIAYAHRIQRAVLPTQDEMLQALPIHFILYKPRNVVSGDFYWLSDKEHHTVMAVMDCTGHGIPGAFMSLIGNDILHEIVNLREIIEPAEILTAMKKRVNIVLKQHTTKGRDGMDIAVCVIDHEPTRQGVVRKLYFAAAHLSLIYFQNRIQGELEGSKIYIGGYDPDETEKAFETKTLLLNKATSCYLFSDGFQDQFAENGRKKFTKKRLKAILTDVHLQSPQIQSEILDETIEEWKGGGEQTDDIIVFGMRF